MKRCSRCREPHERTGQRYCRKCQAAYMRDRRAQQKLAAVAVRRAVVARVKPIEEPRR